MLEALSGSASQGDGGYGEANNREPLVGGEGLIFRLKRPDPPALNLGPETLGVQGLGLKSQTLNRKKPSKP